MPGSGSAGTETAGAGNGADAPGSEAGGTATGNDVTGGSEPGFGEMAGGADLPSMVDTLPTFDEDYGSEGEASSDSEGSQTVPKRARTAERLAEPARSLSALVVPKETMISPGRERAPVAGWSRIGGWEVR